MVMMIVPKFIFVLFITTSTPLFCDSLRHSLSAPKICRVNNFILRRKSPKNTPVFLQPTSNYLNCNSLVLDRHERPNPKELLALLNVLPNTHIVSLHVIGVPINIDIAVRLSAYIENSRLQTIHLLDLDTLDNGMIAILSKAMKDSKELKTIIFANMFQSLSGDASTSLTSMMMSTKANHVDFRGFNGGNKFIGSIIAGFRNPNIKSIGLRQINLNITGLKEIANFIPYSKVEHLDLSGNKLQDIGMKIISRYILKSSTIVELDLSDNLISDIGIIDLAMGLEDNEHIHHLNLLNNIDITDDGVIELNEMLTDEMYGNNIIVSIELTIGHFDKGPSIQRLNDMNKLLKRNKVRKRDHRTERPIPKKKIWPHEGSVSGTNTLIGIDGPKEFERLAPSPLKRLLASGEL
jgi:hypothetical protein